MKSIKLAQVKEFWVRERLYGWLLIFIISINLALFLTAEKEPLVSAQTLEENAQIEKALSQKEKFADIFSKQPLTREELHKMLDENEGLKALYLFLSLGLLLAIGIGLFLDFIICLIKRERAVLVFPTLLHDEGPKWAILDVVKVGILFVWFGYVLVFIESGLYEVFPFIKANVNLFSAVNATILDLLVFVFIIYFAVYKYKDKMISLGISFKNFVKNLFYGIAGYLATIPVLILVMLFVIWISVLLKYKPPMQPVLEFFLEEERRALVTYFSLFVAIFGPIAEEVFFRGFMYTAVKKRLGFKTALFSTSALFALLHANVVGFLPIMVLGMLLAYLFEKTGTIVASCAVHILHNTVMIGLVFLAKALLQ